MPCHKSSVFLGAQKLINASEAPHPSGASTKAERQPFFLHALRVAPGAGMQDFLVFLQTRGHAHSSAVPFVLPDPLGQELAVVRVL